jgi:hypothetical protein
MAVVWAVDTVEDKSLFTQVHCSSTDQSRDKGMFQARYVRDIPPDRIFISWFHGGIHRPNGPSAVMLEISNSIFEVVPPELLQPLASRLVSGHMCEKVVWLSKIGATKLDVIKQVLPEFPAPRTHTSLNIA